MLSVSRSTAGQAPSSSAPLLVAIVIVHLFVGPVRSDDWPTFRHDQRRSGVTPERVDATKLVVAWTYRSPQPPRPAWAGPAKWDAYARIRGLRSMREYDPVYHAIVVGDSLFFGSTSDDGVHCLDAKTGEERWVFFTDAPVRVVPTWSEGRLYFGSDDGHAYCVDAKDGSLLWKRAPTPPGRLIVHNGRMISLSPCRTGVLVDGRTAYFANSLLPWKPSWLCAVDSKTGEPSGDGRYIRELHDVTLEGALLASSSQLIAPQGRVAPLLFSRKDGKKAGLLEGGGGCFVLLTPDSRILHGPGNKTGWITDSKEDTRVRLATYKRGNAMIVAGNANFLLTDHTLAGFERTAGKPRGKWLVDCEYPFSLILAGDTLFVGGVDEVAAFAATTGEKLWTAPVDGKAHGLVAANGILIVSTDQGVIQAFRPRASAVGAPAVEVAEKIAQFEKPSASSFGKTRTLKSPKHEVLELAAGPFLRFDSPRSAIVRWETEEPSTTVVRYGLGADLDRQVEESVESTQHEARLDGLIPGRLHGYVIEARSGERVSRTSPYECDNFFNFSLSDIPRTGDAFAELSKDVEWDDLLGRLLAESETHRGMAVVVGILGGRLPYELARRTKLRVLAVDTDAERIRRARELAYAAGVQGDRLTFRHVESLDRLPFTSCFANLVLSERAILASESVDAKAEMLRIVRPSGGVVYTGASIAKAARIVRGSLEGAGEWSHQYGSPNNSAFGGETLAGARKASDLDVQWIGRPGPRAQPDRNGRKPSPLSTGGRLFVQGLQRLIALDAFNGQILWSWEIPRLGRFNLPRDCSNWCADERSVFVVIDDRCWQIDARTGELRKGVEVPAGGRVGVGYDWGYVARSGDYLLGSAVKKGSSFMNFWGQKNEGWYDAVQGPATFKVTSDFLFAMYPWSDDVKWRYSGGVVLNSTIAVSDGRVLFVECRNEKVVQHESRRIGAPELWKEQFLVALDVNSGEMLWEKPIDTVDGEAVFYLAAQGGSISIVASGKKAYHTYVFDAATGDARWDNGFQWKKGHHGEHMARPAMVGATLFVRPRVYDLASGKILEKQMPGGGCGTYAATSDAFFYRNGNVTVWEPKSGGVSSWSRLRPDCWLSTIPAAGMLLSPEAGGGCSCGSWLETSVGFLPTSQYLFPKR